MAGEAGVGRSGEAEAEQQHGKLGGESGGGGGCTTGSCGQGWEKPTEGYHQVEGIMMAAEGQHGKPGGEAVGEGGSREEWVKGCQGAPEEAGGGPGEAGEAGGGPGGTMVGWRGRRGQTKAGTHRLQGGLHSTCLGSTQLNLYFKKRALSLHEYTHRHTNR